MAKGLTHRQEQILRFIGQYLEENGYPPSIREIGDEFDINSLRGVTVHLNALEKKGYITRSTTPRSIRITHRSFGATGNARMLPLVGDIAAGVPIFSEEVVSDMIPVPQQMVRNIENAFLMRVRGDSMTGEGILPRDLVVIRPQTTASNGDLVAAVINGDESTVKRIHFDNTKVRLMPANPAYDPMEFAPDEVRVVGRVIGVLRDYEGTAF